MCVGGAESNVSLNLYYKEQILRLLQAQPVSASVKLDEKRRAVETLVLLSGHRDSQPGHQHVQISDSLVRLQFCVSYYIWLRHFKLSNPLIQIQ